MAFVPKKNKRSPKNFKDLESVPLSPRTEKELKRLADKARRAKARRANKGPLHSPEEIKNSSWLDPWKIKPGTNLSHLQGGNSPKKGIITDRIEWALELPLPEEIRVKYGMPKGARMADLIAYRLVLRSIESDSDKTSIFAGKVTADRVEGTPTMRIANGDGSNLIPPTITINFVKGKK